jgi:hypothetical protein
MLFFHMIAPLESIHYIFTFRPARSFFVSISRARRQIPAESFDFSDMAAVHEALVAMLNHQLCYFC